MADIFVGSLVILHYITYKICKARCHMQLARSANRLSAVSNTHHCEFDSIIYDDWRIVTVRLVCLVVEVLLGV